MNGGDTVIKGLMKDKLHYILSPSLPSFFPALSLAFFFAPAPLSERLEQANGCLAIL